MNSLVIDVCYSVLTFGRNSVFEVVEIYNKNIVVHHSWKETDIIKHCCESILTPCDWGIQ